MSADGCITKAPLAKESVGKNPTDRGKMGSKRNILVDAVGVPLSIVVTGANRHDVTQLGNMLDSIVIERPNHLKNPQNLCLDAGYTGEPALEIVVLRGYVPHIKGRGDEKLEKEKNPNKRARR